MPDITELVADGELLQRSGTTVVGYPPDSASYLPSLYPQSGDPALLSGSSQTLTVADRAYYYRTVHGGTISKIAVDVATASGNICVGVYRNSGSGTAAVPGTRAATSGAIACPAVGYAEISLGGSIAVDPGDWLAISADNATAAFRAISTSAVTNNIGNGRQAYQSGATPLPATAAPISTPIVGRLILMIGVA